MLLAWLGPAVTLWVHSCPGSSPLAMLLFPQTWAPALLRHQPRPGWVLWGWVHPGMGAHGVGAHGVEALGVEAPRDGCSQGWVLQSPLEGSVLLSLTSTCSSDLLSLKQSMQLACCPGYLIK